MSNYVIIILLNFFGEIAQLARATGSYPVGRGFESPSRYQLFINFCKTGVLCFSVGCGNDSVEEEQPQDQEYGHVEKETAEVLVAKFNTQVVDNSSLNPASDDYLTTHEDAYWYGLITGISLIVYPVEYTGDMSSEIVDYMVLYVEKNSENESMVSEYMEYLIKANNPDITDEEITSLLTEAKNAADSGKTVNNGKGIDIGYVDNEDNYQYQVIRLYE